jgi:hypothetical protein
MAPKLRPEQDRSFPAKGCWRWRKR